MSYDRNAAIAYARRYWDKPCDDGIFWRNPSPPVEIENARKVLKASAKDGWEPRFVPDSAHNESAVYQRFFGGKTEEILIQGWSGLADCAHFLTRCIRAGGIPISEVSVPRMVTHLKSRFDVKVLAEQVTRDRGQRIVDTGFFKKGDILAYFNIDPHGDYNGRRQYSHSTMYVGKIDSGDVGRITCHTKSRFAGLSFYPDEWHLEVDSYTYTFIHVAIDDVAPSRAVASKLSGWWGKSNGVGGYYFLGPSGRASLTMRPPATHLEAPGAPLNSAYWFLADGKITFFWRRGGNVEEWKPTGRPDIFMTTVNGSPAPLATKIVRATARHRRR